MLKLCIATIEYIHDKTQNLLRTVFLKMSPNLSWNSQGSLYRRSDFRAAYDTLMAAVVIAGIVS